MNEKPRDDAMTFTLETCESETKVAMRKILVHDEVCVTKSMIINGHLVDKNFYQAAYLLTLGGFGRTKYDSAGTIKFFKKVNHMHVFTNLKGNCIIEKLHLDHFFLVQHFIRSEILALYNSMSEHSINYQAKESIICINEDFDYRLDELFNN